MTARARTDAAAIWAIAGIAALCIAAMAGVYAFVFARGAAAFWPAPIAEIRLRDGALLLGEVVADSGDALVLRLDEAERRGASYRRVAHADILGRDEPVDAVAALEQDGRRRYWRGDAAPPDAAAADFVESIRPNALSLPTRIAVAARRALRFMTDGSVATGGVLPAIAGTLTLVALMTLVVVPLGVATAGFVHLRRGRGAALVRAAVNTLAGVPSIVYGVIGLGLLVHGFGRSIDQWFHAGRLPLPTFGGGGLAWAALTLALLTLPVFVVSVDLGLSRLPRRLEQASLALGATREQTLRMLLLPAAWPAVLTGLILAIARACGAVAPLMLVGVVELAPSLPLDGEFPYLHPSRQFMHLGYAVYDSALASADMHRGVPRAYACAALLIAIVLVLNLAAMMLRERLRLRYRALEG